MPKDQIDMLMQIWAGTLPLGCDLPFLGTADLYSTIDSTKLGDIPWQSFLVSYQPQNKKDCDAVKIKLRLTCSTLHCPTGSGRLQVDSRDSRWTPGGLQVKCQKMSK